jgi:hypothetical protein
MKESIHTVENFCPQKAAGSAPQILLPEPASITYSLESKFSEFVIDAG